MKLFYFFLSVSLLVSCNSQKKKTGNAINENLGYTRQIVEDSNQQLDFFLPDDMNEANIPDSLQNKKSVETQLLKTFVSPTQNVTVFVSKIHNPDSYVESLSKKMKDELASTFRMDTIKTSAFTIRRFFYKIPDKGLVNFRNFVSLSGNEHKSCLSIDYAMPNNLDSNYQKKIGYSLETISLKRN